MKAQNKLESFLEQYSEQTLIRSAVAAIPYIGGALDVLMSSKIQKKTLERYQFFMDSLKEQVGNLNEKMINHSYLESDEFYDLFVQTSNLVVKTRLEDKIRAYSRILTSAISLEQDNTIRPEDILNIVQQLTENDIILIQLISDYLVSENPKKVNKQIIFDIESLVKFKGNSNEQVVFFGLLSLVKSSIIIKNPVISAPVPRFSYETTPVFELVKGFLTE